MSKIKEALEKAKRIRGVGTSFVLMDEEVLAQPAQRVVKYDPQAIKNQKVITLSQDSFKISERFQFFKTQLLPKLESAGDKTVLITSCFNGEGKTFVAVNLAVMFAREIDKGVLLVDVNFRHPSVLSSLGIQIREGLSDYLLNDKPISELLINPGIEKMAILPPGNNIQNSAEILGSLKMKNLIFEMKDRYHDRYILFDGPSVFNSVDTLVLSQYMDKILLVVESGKVPPQKMSEAVKLLGEEKILGIILNKGNALPKLSS